MYSGNERDPELSNLVEAMNGKVAFTYKLTENIACKSYNGELKSFI